MSAGDARLAVERAIIELHDIDQAAALMASAIQRRVATALGVLSRARDALDAEAAEVRTAIEVQAAEDAANYVRDRAENLAVEDADTWAHDAFGTWLEDEGDEAIEPLSLDDARAVYLAAFTRALGGTS